MKRCAKIEPKQINFCSRAIISFMILNKLKFQYPNISSSQKFNEIRRIKKPR